MREGHRNTPEVEPLSPWEGLSSAERTDSDSWSATQRPSTADVVMRCKKRSPNTPARRHSLESQAGRKAQEGKWSAFSNAAGRPGERVKACQGHRGHGDLDKGSPWGVGGGEPDRRD